MPRFDRRSFARVVLPAVATILTLATRPAIAAPFMNGSFESPALPYPSLELDADRAPAGWLSRRRRASMEFVWRTFRWSGHTASPISTRGTATNS
jgi:hypothetical protein